MLTTIDCKAEFVVYYHGSSSNANIGAMLNPPSTSGVLSEVGRKKNLERVFFTKDLGLAKIYAGRACRSYGGEPKLYRVISPVDVVCLDGRKGSTVFHAASAFVEEIKNDKQTIRSSKK